MKRLALLVCLVAVAACGGSKNSSSSSSTTAKPVQSATAPAFTITSFGPSGSNIGVDFQIDNGTSSEFRFEWAKFVLTVPDGSTHTAYRDPASAPYHLVPSHETYADGGNFQFASFTPGHYKVAYDGKVLAEKDL